MSSLLNPPRLAELITRFSSSRIAILGDFFLDKYLDIDPDWVKKAEVITSAV